MVIDKNTTQINNFSKGMNTDTSDAYLEDGTYRMAVNLRYTTTVGSNSGELHMIEGCTDLIGSIDGQVVKKATQLRNVGIIVTQDASEVGWHVYTIQGSNRNEVAHISSNERVVNKKISVVARYEDDDNQKLYIADGAGPMIAVPLTEGLCTNLNQMLAYPSALLDVPKFAGLISGNLKSGVYQYAYQLYKKHYASSEISVATKTIPLHKGAVQINSASDSEGYEKDVYTDKGIKVQINISSKLQETFDSIFIYRIHYKEVGQIPDIDVVYDDKIEWNSTENKQYMEFDDSGIESLGVITLEEYNAMTGIHIIPKVIESANDFMFAANIQSDNPIYENKEILNWNPEGNVSVGFTTISLVGDIGSDDDKINVGATGFRNMVGNRYNNFISGDIDDNNTYANPYAQYLFKSHRRGETYRYGIILYDEDGNASQVKHIQDVIIPSYSDSRFPVFESTQNGHGLTVHPIGVTFTINNLPSTVAKYEIVRCGRDTSDLDTICQCVLSRPIQRVFEQDFGRHDENDDRPQSTYPLTPTGYVTTQDYMFYMPINDEGKDQTNNEDPIATNWTAHWDEAPYVATNMEIKKHAYYWDIKPNNDIFQAISPEYCYQQESFKDLLKHRDLTIEPVSYIYPIIDSGKNKTWRAGAIAGDTSYKSVTEKYYNLGNKYANLAVKNNYIIMDSRGGTLFSYYTDKSKTLLQSYDNDDFKYNTANDDTARYTYIKLYGKTTPTISGADVKGLGFPETLQWDDFASAEEKYKLKYTDKVSVVGGKNFVNWVSNGFYNVDHSNNAVDDGLFGHFKIDDDHLDDSMSIMGGMMGPGGKCFTIKIDGDQFAGIEGTNYFGTYLCNIKQSSTKYGGDSLHAKENSTYRSFGNLFDASNTTVTVFDGDCYILPFEYISLHKWYHPYLQHCRNACVVYSIPMETNINIPYSFGYEFSKNIGSSGVVNIQDQPANVNNIFSQEKPLYAYDTVNNISPTAKILVAESRNDDMYGTNMDYRVYHSERKSNNEQTDSWLRFKAANYLDVDNRYGPITGLRKFNNSLVFWQQVGAGILQVNERSQVMDENNAQLILGTGEVLGRYDYINTRNGMREGEFADTQSDNVLYWWDHDKRQIMSYTQGAVAPELSKIKFIQSMLNNGDDIDNPILFFDKKNNEAVFKVLSKSSVVFNESIGAFTGLYEIEPSGAIVLNDSLLLTTNSAAVKTWNSINNNKVVGLDNKPLTPYLKYVVNSNALQNKTFDNTEINGRLYGGGEVRTYINSDPLDKISFDFYTPLKQHGTITGDKIDNTEYNFRFAIPRDNNAQYGGRLRGKTMEAVMKSSSNDYDFSLQCIMTKYRISWA